MKKITLLITLLSFCSVVHSQTTSGPEKNGVYVEAGGNGILYSVNYERRFFLHEVPRITARVGFSTLLAYEPFIIPLEITCLFGKKRHFEAGYGYSIMQYDGYSVLRLGYRHESEDKKRVFRVAFTPLLGVVSDDIVSSYPWLGVSYGLRF